MPLLSGTFDREIFVAAGDSAARYNLDIDLNELTIDGFVVDSITLLSGCLPDEAEPPLNGTVIPQQWRQFTSGFMNDDQSHSQIRKSERSRAISRTIIADRDFSDNKGSGRATARFYNDIHSVVYDAPYGTPEAMRSKFCRSSIMHTVHCRQLFVSCKGFLALGPGDAKEGDLLCVFLGVRVPFVLRRENDHYIKIGDCYIDGIMDGELMHGFEKGDFKVDSFKIR